MKNNKVVNPFKQFKYPCIAEELTKISGGAPATNYAGGDVHTTSPQTPGWDDNAAKNSNTCDEGKDMLSGPARIIYNNEDGEVRKVYENATFQAIPASEG